MGLGIGLSGALIPGPLLVFNITETLKHGAKTGFLVILGHFFVEVCVSLLIIFGFLKFLRSPIVAGTVGLAGGILLFLTGIFLFRQKELNVFGPASKKSYGPVLGGVIFTVFNPTFPPWWAAIGYNMLWQGMQVAGVTGLIAILAGHWCSDFGWYALVSFAVARGKDVILREKVYPLLKTVLALFMFFLAVYFIIKAVNCLIPLCRQAAAA